MAPLIVGGLIVLFFLLLTLVIINSKDGLNLSASSFLPPETSPLSEFIEFPWGKIWVYDSLSESPTDTEPLVFIHSMGASIFCWRNQIPLFKTQRRVIAMDMLGYGASDKNILAKYDLDSQTQRLMDLLKVKGITKCSLVGCSMGGALALWMSFLYPEMFTKVVVLAPAALHRLVPLPRWNLDRFAPLAQRLISPRLVSYSLSRAVTNQTVITPEVNHHYGEPFLKDRNTIKCLLMSAAALKDPRIYKSLSQRVTPTLILWGQKDRVINKGAINLMIKEAKNAVFEVHPSGGHHLMEDEAAWVNEKISKFLDSTKE